MNIFERTDFFYFLLVNSTTINYLCLIKNNYLKRFLNITKIMEKFLTGVLTVIGGLAVYLFFSFLFFSFGVPDHVDLERFEYKTFLRSNHVAN